MSFIEQKVPIEVVKYYVQTIRSVASDRFSVTRIEYYRDYRVIFIYCWRLYRTPVRTTGYWRARKPNPLPIILIKSGIKRAASAPKTYKTAILQ